MLNKILAYFAAIAFTASGLHAQTANIGAVQPSHTHSTPEELATLRKLRAGGNVIFIRHERTDHMTPDAQDFLVSSCAGQRNLNAAGVASAEQSGEEIRRLKIPIGQVFASPMCRTQETARFMFRTLSCRTAPVQRLADRKAEPASFDERFSRACRRQRNVRYQHCFGWSYHQWNDLWHAASRRRSLGIDDRCRPFPDRGRHDCEFSLGRPHWR